MDTPRVIACGSVRSWKEQARELLHEAILDAARTTFAEKGYEGATVDEIADRAEVGKGTVYNYIEGGKAGLFAAVLAAHFDDLDRITAEALADDAASFRERFARYAEGLAAYFEQHLDHFVLHLRDVPRLVFSAEGAEQAVRLRARRQRLALALVPSIQAAIERGELRRVPSEMAAQFCFTALLGYLFQACDIAGPAPADAVHPTSEGLGQLVTLVLDGLGAADSSVVTSEGA